MAESDRALAKLREAIEAFATERAPELVAEARAEALARARRLLADAMTDSLLEHAGGALGGRPRSRPAPRRHPSPPARPEPGRPEPAPPAPPRAPHGAAATGELACYVYGVVFADDAQVPEGLAGVDSRHEVSLVEHESLAAITSQVSLAEFGEEELRENLNDVAWLEEKARAHERVLDESLARMTVVPLRLCTIYRGEEQVREMLARERPVFVDALRRLAGKTEWGVKLIAAPGALEHAASAEPGGAERDAGASAGVAYMRDRGRERRAREEQERIAEDWAGEVHERVSARAAEALLNPLQNPEVSGHEGDMLVNGVYLVADDETDSFRVEVESLAAEFAERGADVQLTGPWPPYNFVKGSIEAAR